MADLSSFININANTVNSGNNITTQSNVSAVGNVYGTFLHGCGSNIINVTGTYGNANVTTLLASGTVSTDILTTGTLSTSGNVYGAFLHGDGSNITGLASSYSNANVTTLLASGTVTTDILTTGNVQGTIYNLAGSQGGVKRCGVFSALVLNTSTICGRGVYVGPCNIYVYGGHGADVKPVFIGTTCHFVEVDTGGNVSSPGSISATGNILGGNLLTGGAVSVGGIITIASTAGNVLSTTGNISAGVFYGDGGHLSNIVGLTGSTTGCGACQNTVLGVGAGGSTNSVVLGYNAATFNGGGTGGEVIIGEGATGTYGGQCSVAIGRGATVAAGAAFSVIIGACSTSVSQQGIAIGYRAHSANTQGIAIGVCTTATNPGFYVAPVRCHTVAGGSPAVVGYCTGTREFVYGLSGGGGCYGNSNVETLLETGIANNIITTGNVGATTYSLSGITGGLKICAGLPALVANTAINCSPGFYAAPCAVYAFTGPGAGSAYLWLGSQNFPTVIDTNGNVYSPGIMSAAGNVYGSSIFGNVYTIGGQATLQNAGGNSVLLQTGSANTAGLFLQGCGQGEIFAPSCVQIVSCYSNVVVQAGFAGSVWNFTNDNNFSGTGNILGFQVSTTGAIVSGASVAFGPGASVYVDGCGVFCSPAGIILATCLNSGVKLQLGGGGATVTGTVHGTEFFGSGAGLTCLPVTYDNSNVTTLLSSGTVTTDILTTGNISAANFTTSGAQGNIFGANVISAVTLTATGDVFGNNISATGAIFTPSVCTSQIVFGNITTGALCSSSNFAFDPSTGNLGLSGLISVSGNIISTNFTTSGAQGNITGANIISAITFSASGNTTAAAFLSIPVAVASLPAAVAGLQTFVNDSSVVAAGNFGNIVAGGGANTVPVWGDGTNWLIG